MMKMSKYWCCGLQEGQMRKLGGGGISPVPREMKEIPKCPYTTRDENFVPREPSHRDE